MKKIMLSLGLMLGALTLTNCSNEIDENINTNTDGVAFELTAAIDANRTVANGFKTTWAANDAINLFHAVADETTYTENPSFAIAEEDLANGRFTGTLSEELTAKAYDWYAFYPYSSSYTTPAGTRYYKLWQQTQSVEANSTAHVVGLNGPLYGVAENVAVGDPVKVQMHQLGTLLRVKVGNESGEDFIIESIKVAAANTYITGSFYVGFNKNGVSRCEMSGANYANQDVTLNVTGEYTIADGDDASDHCFYAAVAPFTAPEGGETLTITVVTDKGTYETTKDIPAREEFASGVVNSLVVTVDEMVQYEYTKVTDFSTLSEGDEFVIATTLGGVTGALKPNGTSSAPTFTTVTANGNTIEGVTSDMVFTLGGDATNGYTFNQGSSYLYATNANNGVRLGTGTSKLWTVTANGDTANSFTVKVNTSDVRWLTVYNSQDWRCYKSANENDTNSDDIQFYAKEVKVDDGRQDQTLTFSQSAIEINDVDVANFEAPVLSGAETTVSYTSSNTAVANVDATTGVVTLTGTAGDAVITATAAESESWNMASASYTITVVQSSIPTLTAEEFNAKAVNADVYYQISGIIQNVADTKYGNFDLVDATGKVYVYGLYSPEGASQYWATSGVQEGDFLTVEATRGEFSGNAQALKARYVSHYGIDVTVPTDAVAAAGGSVDVAVVFPEEVTGATPEVTCEGEGATATYADGKVTVTFGSNSGNTNERSANVKLTYGDVYTVFTVTQATDVVSATSDATLSFASTANRTSFTTSQQVWSQNGITLTNDKGSSTSNVANYSNPARFYKNSKLTITMGDKEMTKIVFDCNSASYATALKSSITSNDNYTVSTSSDKVTVAFVTPVTSFTIASLTGGQIRMDSLTVTYNN